MENDLHRVSPASTNQTALAAFQVKADQGDADAQFSLGLHYSSAPGDALDFAQAARWYRKAAEQDHALAQFNLAQMFALGQGVPRDYSQAGDWMRKAAEGGDAGGQHNLGVRCHRASADPRCGDAIECRIEAYKWFELAAAQGYDESLTARHRITLSMSHEEVAEATSRAAAFKARRPVDAERD